jgi:hypothetical protein
MAYTTARRRVGHGPAGIGSRRSAMADHHILIGVLSAAGEPIAPELT